MKRLVVVFAVMTAAVTAPLHAEETPWCVELDVFTKNCAFASHDECLDAARNARGTCVRNSKYQPPAAAVHAKAAAHKTSAKLH
jgi:hypothetical protein